MKNILLSSKIIKDKYGQLGQFVDLSWFNFFQNKVNLISVFPNSKIKIKNLNIDGLILSGGNDLYSIKKKKKILLEMSLKKDY